VLPQGVFDHHYARYLVRVLTDEGRSALQESRRRVRRCPWDDAQSM
jgi:hypothetical protein